MTSVHTTWLPGTHSDVTIEPKPSRHSRDDRHRRRPAALAVSLPAGPLPVGAQQLSLVVCRVCPEPRPRRRTGVRRAGRQAHRPGLPARSGRSARLSFEISVREAGKAPDTYSSRISISSSNESRSLPLSFPRECSAIAFRFACGSAFSDLTTLIGFFKRRLF